MHRIGMISVSLYFPSFLFSFFMKLMVYVVIQRNYRFFFLFVSSSTLLCIYIFSMSALYIKILMRDEKGTVWKAMQESPASVVLMAYCFISLWFVGGLTGFHLYLISSNQVTHIITFQIIYNSIFTSISFLFLFFFYFQTTYENFRYRSDNRYNVYNRGCINNFLEVFCTKIKPSKNKFRAPVQEEVHRPPPTTVRDSGTDDGGAPENRRMKVEDDLDFGGDILKISQRHNIEDIESEIRSRGNDSIEL